MKKFILPCLFCLAAISACNKKEKSEQYLVGYNVYYYPAADSYSAAASFVSAVLKTEVQLQNNDWVSFNGRSADYVQDQVYYWKGKGKPNVNFVMHKGKNDFYNTVNTADIPDYEFLIDDTLSIQKGFTIKVKNYVQTKPGDANLNFIYPNKRSMGYILKTDSLYLPSISLNDFLEGKMIIQLRSSIKKKADVDAGDAGDIYYLELLEKNVYVIK